MHTRNTVLMAGLLVILATFVYFYEIRGGAEREEAERQAELLVHFDVEDVTGIEVTTSKGAVVATRQDKNWAIVEPARIEANGEALDGLVDRVHGAKQERLVVEGAENLAPFGLAEPLARVTVRLDGGDKVSLAVGKDTPVGANVYVSPDDGNDVYSANIALKNGLDKSLFDLRDKTVLDFEESGVQAIELSTPDLSAELRRSNDETGDKATWDASRPFSGPADAKTIDDLLSSLHTAEATGFILDQVPDQQQLTEFGLDKPRIRLTLRAAEHATQTLLIGAESTSPAGRYAMHDGGSSVFVVADDLVDDLPEGSDQLRNKQVLAVARDRVKTLSIDNAGSLIELRRDGADWHITRPRAIDADASAVSRVLSALQDMRAAGFANTDQPGDGGLHVDIGLGVADSEELDQTVSLRVGATTRIVPIDKRDDDNPEEVDARYVIAGDDPTVYIVAEDDLEDLRTDLFALRAKTLVQFTQSDLTGLEIGADGEAFTLEHDGDSWSMTAPTKRTLEESSVSDLLWDLNYLRMEGVASEWDAGSEPDLAVWGLSAPRLTISASTADGVAARVRVGNEAPAAGDEGSARVYVMVDDRPAVFEVGASIADSIEKLVDKLRAE